MIKAELKSEDTFCFFVDASIFNENVLSKALYWYADKFIIYWEKIDNSIHQITLTYKANIHRIYSFNDIINKLNQDLIDYKNRDIIINETRNIRDILYVKAFANNDDFEDFNLISQ